MSIDVGLVEIMHAGTLNFNMLFKFSIYHNLIVVSLNTIWH